MDRVKDDIKVKDDIIGKRNSITPIMLCIGLLAGGLMAIARALYSTSSPGLPSLSIWGFHGYIDFPLFLLAGAVAGILAALFFALVQRLALITFGKLTWITILVLGLMFALFWLHLARNDPATESRSVVTPSDRPRPPDIVIVVYDAVRADFLADADGSIPHWSPNLRALSEDAVLYRNAVAPAPWTVPSHASLFTGLSPLDHGAVEEFPVLRRDLVTLAERLREEGYYTVGLTANAWLSRSRGFDQGFDQYFELWRGKSRKSLPLSWQLTQPLEDLGWLTTDNPRRDKGSRQAARVGERMIHHLDPEVPLFLFINLIEAHPTLMAPGQGGTRFISPDLTDKGIVPQNISQDWKAILTGQVTLDRDDRAVLRALYQGEIAYMDRHLVRILDALKERGRFENAMIAVTSDHGLLFGKDRCFGTGFDLREEMLRIPMVVKFPANQTLPRVSDRLVYLHDLHPTALELAAAGHIDRAPADQGGSTLGPRGGHSLLADTPRTQGISSYARAVGMIRGLWAQYPGYDASFLDRRMLSVRQRRSKFVWSSDGTESFYDLSQAGERENLIDQRPAEAEQARELLRELIEGDPEEVWSRALARARRSGDAIDTDDETLRTLRALGYVE